MREGERLDAADLVARRWYAEDRLVMHARGMTRTLGDPAHVERLESACLHGDQAEMLSAVADLLESIEA